MLDILNSQGVKKLKGGGGGESKERLKEKCEFHSKELPLPINLIVKHVRRDLLDKTRGLSNPPSRKPNKQEER